MLLGGCEVTVRRVPWMRGWYIAGEDGSRGTGSLGTRAEGEKFGLLHGRACGLPEH